MADFTARILFSEKELRHLISALESDRRGHGPDHWSPALKKSHRKITKAYAKCLALANEVSGTEQENATPHVTSGGVEYGFEEVA